MKQHIHLTQTQQLNLSPQLKQAIKLLQCSQLDFDLEIKNYLETNPLLEISNDTNDISEAESQTLTPENNPHDESTTDTNSDIDTFDPESSDSQWSDVSGHNYHDDDHDPMFNIAQPISLREKLLEQLSEYPLSTRDQAIITLLIDELDDHGMLSTSLEEIAEHLPLDLMLTEEELSFGLNLLQQFEPAGVGARNIQESLLLQAKSRPQNSDALLAQFILTEHFDLLANKQSRQLAKILQLPEKKINDALTFISALSPYPASELDHDEQTHYISPDITVKKHHGKWVAHLNKHNQPNIQLNQLYAQAVASYEGKTELSGSLQEAQWLLKSIQQRFETIYQVAQEIVQVQQEFFDEGEIAMKPLTLKEIASKLEIHESTVSRACNQKYLLCSKGLYELKYFFNQSVSLSGCDADGDNISNMAIKAKIRDIVAQEDAKKPLSDEKIAQLLIKENITVARRTITKYRESMNIPPARDRKLK